ncbi:histone chaperone Chz1 [Schizosaccharomyces japonicus yFS275]|uniref:Histone chaperone Chz1 n=1 Tax=Schizosaccharomyces japonicus (strain yFS275 / FY16936) TaxID=402676 RepID=B6JZJ5_SCHJY|nr:histone chaperone Chz1 [Schizosaccharomyces japonicus yFS275]EEB06963.1 histone chaperone Chz1 [Schizosaccharomyces japonicus yFS275]
MSSRSAKSQVDKGKAVAKKDPILDFDDDSEDVDFSDDGSENSYDDSDSSMDDEETGNENLQEDLAAIDPRNITCSTRTRRKKIDFTKAKVPEDELMDEDDEDDEDYIPPQ